MKRRKETAPVAGYLAAFLAPALIGVIMAVTWPLFELVSVAYLFAVIFCAWYSGIGPGLLSVLISFLIAVYFFIQPYYAFWPVSQNNAVRLTVLVSVGIFISIVCELLHRATRRAEVEFDELKRVEEVLRESQERYKLLFENNPFPVWVFDIETLEFLAVNYAATLYYGYSREEFLNMTIKDIRPQEYVRDLQETVSSVRGRLKWSGIWKHRKKDGHVFDVEITSHELIFDGRPSRLVLANDVSDRERARLDIQRLNEELEQRVFDRTAELQVVNKELEAFSYSVSHDLRAPLRHINGFGLALLEDYSDVLDETGKNYLREVRGASQEMGLLIDDILELARVSRSEMKREPIDLSQMAHSIMSDLQKSNPNRILAVEIENGLSTHGDRRLIQIMLNNLLGNAWKFTSRTAAAEMAFGTQVVSGQIHYFVRDNGAGFDMKYVDKLFGAFQRLHNTTEFEGTGIGLATVQRIVHRHGGRVWAEGSVNAGASFYFTLPGPREVINGHQNHTAD